MDRCTCCDKPLKGKVRMLELDQRMQAYHDFGGVPDDQSQGWFPFGLTCAKKKLAEAQAIIDDGEPDAIPTPYGGYVLNR